MRRSWMLAAAVVALLAPVVVAGAASASSQATERTVVRPVTASGHIASFGTYVVRHNHAEDVYCSGPDSASVVAVDESIVYCSPSAAYAVACWRAAKAHHVLCMRQADSKHLDEFPVSGPIAHSTAPAHPVPLNFRLANGVFCDLRDGGTGPELRQHPAWYASYYCTHGQNVWAAHGFGIDRDKPVWTVELASDTGKQRVHTARVTRAWFVGTKS